MIHRRKRWAAVALGSLMVASACVADDDDASGDASVEAGAVFEGAGGYEISMGDCPSDYDALGGIGDDKVIRLGSSAPQSGNYAAFAAINQGAQAYFKALNEAGGIDGYTIELKTVDDAYEPSRTTTNVTELVESDGVFGIFAVVGTPNNVAVRDYLNDECIPQMFATTGSTEWAKLAEYPWTTGAITPYPTEAATYAAHLDETHPDGATIAVLGINNDFGTSYLAGLEAAVEGTNHEIVATETVEAAAPSVTNELTTLAASQADVLMGFISGALCPQTMVGVSRSSWEPQMYLSNTCSSIASFFAPVDPAGEGVMMASYRYDPADPTIADEDWAKEYFAGVETHMPDANAQNSTTSLGWALADVFATAVEAALEEHGEVTRPGVMPELVSLDYEAPFLLPGVTWSIGGVEDPWPIEQARIVQYTLDGDSGTFQPVTDVLDIVTD